MMRSFLAIGLTVLMGTVSLVTGQEKLRLAPQGKYAGIGLDTACENVLYMEIDCNSLVGELGTQSWHGTVGSKATTDSICSSSCSTALTTARRRIEGSCRRTPHIVEGYPALALIDSIRTGWNETCQKDQSSGDYCNTIIESFEDAEELSDMPEDELCSYCFGGRLRMMQSSPYSAYDEMYADMLEYVNEECGVESPTDILPDPININYTLPDRCEADRRYKVKEGDTCDSIAESNSVSGATLYYINPELNCTEPTPGLDLCLPDQCETTYKVQSADESCVQVAVSHGTSWKNVIDWNIGIDIRCSNIWSTNPFWGRVLCLSAPGGEFIPPPPGNGTTPGNGGIGGPGGNGEGYSDRVVDPPQGASVAEGTTKLCGEYVQAQEGKGCETILAGKSVTMKLFLDVNPSLGKVAIECSDNLVAGKWYCLHPHRSWNDTIVPESD